LTCVAPRGCARYDASNWKTLIGKRRYYLDLVRIMRGQVGFQALVLHWALALASTP
jgi:hypothetical protein